MYSHICFMILQHRVDRVPGFLFSCPNWLPPPPYPQASVAPPPFGSRGDTLASGKGAGGQFGRRDRHSGTLGIIQSLYVLYEETSTLVWYNKLPSAKISSSSLFHVPLPTIKILKLIYSISEPFSTRPSL